MLILQRFEYRAGTKESLDAAWEVANDVMEKTGNWGNVKEGVKCLQKYATSWGGIAILEFASQEAMDEYVIFHGLNYGHIADISFTPIAKL